MRELLRYAHLVGAVLFTGYALFQVLILRAIHAEHGSGEATRLQAALGAFRWPPMPVPLQATLSGLGWLFIAFLAGTGTVMILAYPTHPLSVTEALADPQGRLMLAKLSLVVILALAHWAFAGRPRRRLAVACGVLTILIVAISALLGR